MTAPTPWALQERIARCISDFEEVKRTIQKPDKKPCCPICGSEYYEEEFGDFVCSGCSVMFQDPEKFFHG